MADRDLLDQLEAIGADTVYFIKQGDGESWTAHVRMLNGGPSQYAVAKATTLREAIEKTIPVKESKK